MLLQDLHESLNVTWHTQGGFRIPWNYGEVEAELEALQHGAALLDFCEYGLLQLKGPDCADFLHNQCTSDIRSMLRDGWLETLFLNAKGQIEHLGLVLHLGESFWISSPTAQALANRFSKYIVFDQVEIEELPWSLLRLQGPEAEAIAQKLVSLPPRWSLRKYPELALARDELGLWLLVPTYEASRLAQRLLEAGATPVGREAWHIWRVERGVADLPEALGELPQEVGLAGRVSYKKGCYLGQEIMARLEARGNTRYQLMGLLGQKEIPSGAEVFREGRPVGRVGTSVESPTHGAIALALLRKELAPGDQVQIEGWSATVSGLPMR
ncbi:MAG: glycine cleavage T C-terminal barrel domain-containing protein [Meiothermus sp.]|uniref:CAF17-like 4Fe-4S cluster assembly/insertion protein YgfZ n=1 Tax=Meiothermus sp. TaxID=1955249 RepID=UPI0028CCF9D6|nr:glycine cleavage T C-terminal barrel domain-containing protein [Meiothermus sp.]MDT7920347.1 glycine cleavage T C-terminal barrel domain-containing protein [Meiothermus sp.]